MANTDYLWKNTWRNVCWLLLRGLPKEAFIAKNRGLSQKRYPGASSQKHSPRFVTEAGPALRPPRLKKWEAVESYFLPVCGVAMGDVLTFAIQSLKLAHLSLTTKCCLFCYFFHWVQICILMCVFTHLRWHYYAFRTRRRDFRKVQIILLP